MAPKERPPPRPDDQGDGPRSERMLGRLAYEFNASSARSQDAPPSAVDLTDAPPISPIALAAGREILFGVTMDMCDWSASHLRSAGDAAWRGDAEPLGAHLREARNALEAAFKTYGVLEAELAEVPA
jgi:hypothetical protein